MAVSIRRHRAHDYDHLIARWKKAGRAAGLRIDTFAEAAGYKLYFLESKAPKPGAPDIYLSAGIHGDEPGATEGLLDWVEKNAAACRGLRLLVFPCLNPWGLVHNTRFDANGEDLNRSYHRQDIPQITAQKGLLGARRFDLAIMLHEDYDGNGIYLYEIRGTLPHWGEGLLKSASRFVPIEARKTVDGRRSVGGVVRRKISPELMRQWPEAFPLYFYHCSRVFTVETPSEFALDARAHAHSALLRQAVKNSMAERKGNLR
jgi:murein peptide amidase A